MHQRRERRSKAPDALTCFIGEIASQTRHEQNIIRLEITGSKIKMKNDEQVND